MGVILFLFLFVFTPSLAFTFGSAPLIIPVAAVMVALAVEIAIMFHRAHKKLYPAESSERLESFVKMILCPPVSIRAADILTRNLLAEYSPIVLASVLPGSSEQQFVRSVILDLKHPLRHEVSDADCRTDDCLDCQRATSNACLHYLKPEELLAPTSTGRELNRLLPALSLSVCGE